MARRAVFLVIPGAAAVACTSLLGDFEAPAVSIDASDAGDAAPDAAVTDDSQAVVHAVTADVSAFVGQPVTVNGSASTTTHGVIAFSWKVVRAPAGSLVSTSTLIGASSASASFVPDLDGEYDLDVAVSAEGNVDTSTAKVSALLPQVLFAEGQAIDGGGGSLSYNVADIGGGNVRPVLCPDVIGETSIALAAYAGRAFDYWEAVPGQNSKFAAFTVDLVPDAGLYRHLWAGTVASSCSGAPAADLGTSTFGPGRPFGSAPHFSPDGSRFVVVDRQLRIWTYAADPDGEAPRMVAAYSASAADPRTPPDPFGFDGGAWPGFEPLRVEWTANGLAWAQPTASGWEVVTAPDHQGAAPATYMTCKGITPREIAMLRDGTVVASYRATLESSENLYQLKPDGQQNCYHEQRYTNLGDSGTSAATDFAVSPDGTQIAFLQIDTTLQDASKGSGVPSGYIYVVPVSGGNPTLVSGEAAVYGPRWIGGGTALVFTRLDSVQESTGRPATSIVVMSPDGGGVHVVGQGDGVNTFVSSSGN